MNKPDASRPEGLGPIVPGHPIPFHGEDTKIYDQLSRIGKGVPLLSHPEWLSVAQLVPAWAKELAETTASFYDLRDKLWYDLREDVVNGFFDDPLRDGSRLGLRVIGPGGYFQYMEGRRLRELFREMEESILLSKEDVLESARRHKRRPPSWCSEATKRETQPSQSQVKLKPAPEGIIIEGIKWAYDIAEHEGRKPPNIKELPAAVQPFLQHKGVSASGRRIQQLGDHEEFKRRRRRPGKTVASERQK
jgi:hypothetical protein